MQAAKELGFDAHASGSIKNAISHILSNSNEDFWILVCGSLYLAGDLLISNR
ncbi:MAG: hypothetical protein ACK5WS_04905 [Alphaproteobacteria bacterium]|jgi:dihydrofolate synthase/folylpolyglutamate synthase|nr:hypothetical protein [Candidatus Jidaibacter sp.]